MRRPCLECGSLSESSYCSDHQPVQASARDRGYPAWWGRLSRSARSKQSYCSTCFTPGEPGNPLTLHHVIDENGFSPAWAKVHAGQRLTMRDAYNRLLSVECQRCNNAKGVALNHAVPQRMSRA